MMKLKPCPICGNQPNISSTDKNHKYFCGVHCSMGDWQPTKSKAAQDWNRRTKEQKPKPTPLHKPCPYCGYEKAQAKTRRTRTGHYGDGTPGYHVKAYIKCGRCSARGGLSASQLIPSKETQAIHNDALKRHNAEQAEYDALIKLAWENWDKRKQ